MNKLIKAWKAIAFVSDVLWSILLVDEIAKKLKKKFNSTNTGNS